VKPPNDLRLLVLDVDGVLTDGTVLLGATEEIKAFHVRDGAGMALWRDSGGALTFLTGRGGNAVQQRAKELRIDRIWEGAFDKSSSLLEILKHYSVAAEQVAAMGDDIQDLAWLSKVGFSAAPGDAAREVKEQVHFVTKANGGRGAVREFVEHLLKNSGRWDSLVESLS